MLSPMRRPNRPLRPSRRGPTLAHTGRGPAHAAPYSLAARIPALALTLALASCSDYAVNGKAEADPDFDGGDSFAPPTDSDDTTLPHDTGSCDGFAAPDPYTVDARDDCVNEPTVGSFTPIVEWQWNANPVYPGYDQIMSTPAIANLTDDDGDGVITEDDVPDICFTSFAGGAYTSAGTLTCISGNGSGTLWSSTGAGGYGIYSSGGVAMGDIDADGSPDVCVAATNASVLCLEHDGSFKMAGGTEPGYVACPAIADMDGDGLAEVVVGRQVFSHDGTTIVAGAGGTGSPYQMSFPVDMDGDGILEVVAGNTIYKLDGTTLWVSGSPDEIPAVGDFNADGRPEVVTSGGGYVRLIKNSGALSWEVPVYGGGSGGAPTVADFDGDGQPEVGVAGASYYAVYDTDGTVLWANPVSDYSSNVTGSSVFDFEGDGNAEVVYADEHTLWVFDGKTGAIEVAESGHASGTLFEYPLIADVDHDGSTEIIVASNNYAYAGWNGITVIGDAGNTWAPARPIWNQFAYHITNVNNDGSIPAHQVENWRTWNNFRAGGTELGPSSWLAELAPGPPSLCLAECADDSITFYAAVENAGLLGAKDVTVDFVRADGTTSHTEVIALSEPGNAAILGPFHFRPVDWGSGPLTMVIDGADLVAECDETNNTRDLGGWPCP